MLYGKEADTMSGAEPDEATTGRGHMLSRYADFPNAVTAVGLLFAIFAIYFAVRDAYAASMLMLLWATLCDWLDGPAARRAKSRPEERRQFGKQLDSFADLVSSSIAPAMVLLSVGNYSALYLPGAILLIFAGVTRLAYFNIHGIDADGAFVGLPVPANVLIITLVFLVHGMVADAVFSFLLYTALVTASVLNVAPIRVPKPAGYWYGVIVVYVLAQSVVFGSRI